MNVFSPKKLIALIVISYVGYYVVSESITKIKRIEFSGVVDGANFPAKQIAVYDFAAKFNQNDGKIDCSHIDSNRAVKTVSIVNNVVVCCDTDEWLVPYRDVNGRREYLCGKWPNLEVVSKSLEEENLGKR
ncbi:hypothetical protein OCF84_21900 (plasmid) [Shewanella xiamenensis]|uniref:hypothetical protein n=1 Tax=Shewanella TaxID=22 RepID=UPI00217D6B9B|nr:MULTISPECIES: hypothetical protein [Shewanella]MCS6162414.1 hypothetical protein [Shewanella baltica]WHF58056.1 hypothetical protein OCF84_21900 [Shewanella xiamenensis]